MKIFLIALFIGLVLFSTSSVALAQQSSDCVPGSTNTNLCNPIRYSLDDLGEFIFAVIASFTNFFAITALIMIIFAGFRMIVAQGNSEALTTAKDGLKWALSGLILSLFAFIIVNAMADYLGAKDLAPSSYIGNNPVRNPLLDNTFLDFLIRMLTGFLSVVGIMAILMIIVSGFRYATARGDEEQVTSAKQSLQWAVIGLGVIILSYVLVRATLTFFGG
ncbi:MAG: hypothetical protein A3B10_02825 [Candidatus Doudnabacteria bacterium RIFCSPLOWO2_01_FULL_44_21]|uniref:Uncharacterized protein n=1 Tax=Candidatus Doudnabacteria bacterium RIFCSPLOWO2_01_FULL_44_21 TaxID=1817841 RepID=A0A1F5Q207_9BACT|nr:MAG: hypothetical protein A3B95_03095 [Candidatus Doudnabacteria bacterium RIFCSPHIGHO2_02_FULL_43_13b]OGE96221.1 MAG: hypothetical protein A3B10_02825 [Candidatus Doudnabacteria bacterium RIFCSPLOWO2_01_FULL_44_21]